MALQVWLPLTQDTRNQGLASGNINWTTAASFTNNGKLGGKALTTGGCKMPASMTSQVLNNTAVSIACWLYVNADADDSSNRAMIFGNDTMSSLGGRQFSIFRYPNSDDIHLSWQNYNNGTYSGAVVGGVWSGVLTPHAWNHICVTYQNPNVKIYVNGVQVGSTSGVINTSSFAYDTYIIHSSSSHYINDFRIYDNCLSPTEVKELSKGLILHYLLNGNNGAGNPNLLSDFDTSFQSYTDGTVTLFSNQMNGGTQEIVSNINGINKCLHLHSLGGNNRQYRTKSVSQGKTYTISADYYSTNAQSTAWRGELNGGNYSWQGAGMAYTTPGKWQRLYYTYSNLTSDATIYFFIYCANGQDCYVKNIKIEEGSSATPWCSASSMLVTTEYDCSGYGNNGTRIGTFSWVSDIPKYTVSTYFEDGSTSYITSSIFMPTDKITTSVWFKGDGATSGANSYHIPFCIGSGTAEFSVDSAKLYRQGYYINGTRYCDTISGAIVNDGQWHMMTATYDGTTLCRYLDGQLINSKAISGTLNGGTLTLLIGKYYSGGYNNKKVKQSDVRIYATALSASDVLSLYQNNAYIDTNGTIHGKIRN